MKKSDIFIEITRLRSRKSRTGRQDLASALKGMSTDLKDWDEEVDLAISTQVIIKIASTKGELAPAQIVRDIDILLQRMR